MIELAAAVRVHTSCILVLFLVVPFLNINEAGAGNTWNVSHHFKMMTRSSRWKSSDGTMSIISYGAGFVHESRLGCRRSRRRRAFFTSECDIGSTNESPRNVAIIGGGLAGLSVAYHMLELRHNSLKRGSEGSLARSPLHITIYDQSKVGEGGASAVAGGLLHPFSPKGKLIHFGLEGLKQSNHLVQTAVKYQPACLIQPHLYRIALNEQNVKQLQDTATKYPELATWLSSEDIYTQLGANSLGGLKLSNGCQVIHVPQYLRGLWEACKTKATECGGTITWDERKIIGNNQSRLPGKDHDTVILAAGAGIVQHEMLCKSDEEIALPAQLVRGQSVIMGLSEGSATFPKNEALLCGKYISPLPSGNIGNKDQTKSKHKQFIIGATHEYKSTKLDETEVIQDMRERTYQLSPCLWDHGVVEKLTCGVRMQSNRGKYGRMPIVGRLDNPTEKMNPNVWLFTGLSSRGLIYHGFFGRMLANAVMQDDERVLSRQFEEFEWWKPSK